MGDMAVSNSIGSNVFDILIGLGLPWALQTLAVDYGSYVSTSPWHALNPEPHGLFPGALAIGLGLSVKDLWKQQHRGEMFSCRSLSKSGSWELRDPRVGLGRCFVSRVKW